MNFYVIYKEYSEYNQFEGSWDDTYSVFTDIDDCKDFIVVCKASSDMQFIAGPLIWLEE